MLYHNFSRVASSSAWSVCRQMAYHSQLADVLETSQPAVCGLFNHATSVIIKTPHWLQRGHVSPTCLPISTRLVTHALWHIVSAHSVLLHIKVRAIISSNFCLSINASQCLVYQRCFIVIFRTGENKLVQ